MTKLYLNGEDPESTPHEHILTDKDKELIQQGLKGIKLTYDTAEDEEETTVFGTKI